MKRLINLLRRSMLAQIASLCAFFFVACLYLFAFSPFFEEIRERQTVAEAPDLEGFIRGALVTLQLSYVNYPQVMGEPADTAPFRPEIMAANPDLRYFVTSSAGEYSNGGSAQYYDETIEGAQKSLDSYLSSDACVDIQQLIRDESDALIGAIWLSHCGENSFYVEATGITSAVNEVAPMSAFLSSLWRQHWRWAVSLLGLIIVSIAIFALNINSLRQMVTFAESIDPDSDDASVPTHSLPMEVEPVAFAINELIGRMQAAKRRERFFLSAAAHEMRNPLTALRTELEFIEDSSTRKRLVNDVARLTRLVNGLLSLMSSKQQSESLNPVDLVSLAEEVVHRANRRNKTADITIRFETELESFNIWAVEDLIESAIENLVENAISFSPTDGEIVLRIDVEGQLSVQDQGPGIDADLLPNLFEPFAKSPPNRDGHGLGLAIVKAVTELHGGRVFARNMTPGGALIGLSLPVAA